MEWDVCEEVVRYIWLREELKPVEVYPVDTLQPIRPDWVAVTHGITRCDRRPGGVKGYNLYFLLNDGCVLARDNSSHWRLHSTKLRRSLESG